jgi:hypothetical protein
LQLQPRRTARIAWTWIALLALSIPLGAAFYDVGVPPSCPTSPETGALQQGTVVQPQARKGMSAPSSFSARFESADELEGSAPTSPRAPDGAGASRLWVPISSTRSAQVWARR